MSTDIPAPAVYARRVAVAAREGLAAYLDACAALREGLVASPREQRIGLRELTRVCDELGITLIGVCRTIEELSGRGVAFSAQEDPRLALPLLRPIAESMMLMRGDSLPEIAARPLVDPDAVAQIAARPAIAAFLAIAPAADA